MRTTNYRILVNKDSVDAECDSPFRSKAARRFFGSLLLALGLFMFYFAGIRQGRNPGTWATLAESRPSSPGFALNIYGAVLVLIIVIAFLATGIRYLLKFGERLQCDRNTLIWSKIPWVSFANRWVTRSIPVNVIVRASYGIVYKSKGVYGILIEDNCNVWKLFWGIEAPEANRILHGLKQLGVNVHHDSEMRDSIRETLRDRRAEL
jgi:hypothetical protein